jgi:hypothetical protein
MTTLEATGVAISKASKRWTSLLALVFGPTRPKALLDPRTLPGHLKRDIGFCDGNETHRRHL